MKRDHSTIVIKITIGFIAGIVVGGMLGDAAMCVNRKALQFRVETRLKEAARLMAAGKNAEARDIGRDLLTRVSEKKTPYLYARVKQTEGIALFNLAASSDTVKTAAEALAAFREALKVFSPGRYPLQYAEAQNNIGVTQALLFEETRDPSAKARAMTAYNEALKYYPEKDFPAERARVLANIARTQAQK